MNIARPAQAGPSGTSARAFDARPPSLVVGIGEFGVSDTAGTTIVTHALGSCVAVCVWDPTARVGGILHFLLPDSRINPTRASIQPATFANTGIPRMFDAAQRLGLRKSRTIVYLVGGAEMANDNGSGLFDVGKRNVLAARRHCWQSDVLVRAECVGGTLVRTVRLMAADGQVLVTSGRDVIMQW